MARTRHFKARTSQRGIRQGLVDLTLRCFGEDNHDKRGLGEKALQRLLDELRELERKVIRAMDKGGLVVVEVNGALVTAYRAPASAARRACRR
jgi:hypothetical protein